MTDGTIAFLVVEPDGRIDLRHEVLGVTDAQAILNSDFEVMPEPEGLFVTILAATDGKTRGDDPNWGITRLIRQHLRAGDFVAGRVIVTGGPNAAGDLTSLTVKDEQAIRTAMKDK